jgi:beta-galactosidase
VFLPLLGGEGRGEGWRRPNFFATFCFAALCYLLFALATTSFAVGVIPFDDDWKFLKGDAPGAEQPGFDDSNWRKLNLPHDWSIEEPFSKTNKTGGAGAWLPSRVGWYRKEFVSLPDYVEDRVSVEFDGVMQNSGVWINGVSLAMVKQHGSAGDKMSRGV